MAPRPPVDKLPLALRKEIRDTYEAQKPELLQKLESILGKPYTIDVDPNQLYAYADDRGAKENPGRTIVGYINGLITGLENLVQQYGSQGVQHFNDAVSTSAITIERDDTGKIAYSGCEIKNGKFLIVFNEKYFGSNLNRVSENLSAVIDAVPRSGGASANDDFPLVIKQSIAKQYTPEIDKVKAEIEKILNLSGVVLEPNFVDNYKTLEALGKEAPRDWRQNFGSQALAYFNGLKWQLEAQGFAKDDMLQEGLTEALASKTFQIRTVEKLERKTYCECVIKDDVCYLQTLPKYWSTNMKDAAAGLVDLL